MDCLSNPFFWLSMTITAEVLIVCVAALSAGINDQNVSIPFMMFAPKDNKMSNNTPSIKIYTNQNDPIAMNTKFHPCDYGITIALGTFSKKKVLEFGFFNDIDLIDNLIEGLPKLKAAIKRGKSAEKEDNMNAKVKLVGKIQSILNATTRFKPENKEVAETLADSIIEAVKEEMKGNPQFDHTWEGTYEIPPVKPCTNCGPTKAIVFFNPKTKCCTKCGKQIVGFKQQEFVVQPETTLDIIQGYTENEWEDIAEGKYWCEFSLVPFESNGHKIIGKLSSYGTAGFFMTGDGQRWSSCRPAQSKGIMRPIFVEPVDKDARCIFCDKSGDVRIEILWVDLPTFGQHEPDQLDKITKYIEL